MAAEPTSAATPEPLSEEGVDARLRDWFDALLAQPVPEVLLRHLDQLDGGGKADQASSA